MRTSRRRHDLASGLTAGAGLLILLAGVPTALAAAVGWPLPRAVPRVETVMAALRYGQIAPTTLLQALAVVLWLTWAAIAIGVVLEVTAVLRGTVARILPGLGPVQHLAARLVATVMLLSVASRAAADAPPVAWPPVEAHAGENARTTPPGAPGEQRATDGGWWTVQRHDSLWTIAERTLGDGHRWREIATRNIGRPQPDGGGLRRGDTLIRPGWRLELPPDAVVSSTPARVTVTAGDHLWGIAEQHLDDGERWREIYAHNRGRRQPGGGRLEDPDILRPGWVLDLPDDTPTSVDGDAGRRPAPAHRRGDAADDRPGRARRDAERASGDAATEQGVTAASDPSADAGGSGGAPVPGPVTPSTLAPAAGTRPAVGGSSGSEPAPPGRPRLAPTSVGSATSGRSDPTALAPLATAVLAACLVGLLAHRRRHWLRRRPVGATPARVDPEAAELERWLRSMADHDLTHRIDRVLCVLAEHFAIHAVAPQVHAVELGENVVLHLTSASEEVPPRITSADGGRRWIVGAELEMMSAERDHRYVPALMSCGRRTSGALLQLDPTAVGGVGVSGPDEVVADAMTSWTTELAATGAARGVELVVVGRHHPLVERLARVSIAADATAAIERVRRLLDAGERADAAIVVLCGAGATDDAADALVDLARHPRVGLVVAGRQDTPVVMELADGGVHLLPDDVGLDAPEWLTPDDWDRFGDLLELTDRVGGATSVPPALRPALALDDLELDTVEPPASGHLVGVLGPLTIDGRPPAIADDASELLTWLAIHRTGADAGALHGLLRPGRAPDVAALGDAIGELDALFEVIGPIVVHTDDDRFELRDSVTTDLAHCDVLLRGLDRHPPPVQARRMYAALELVRGEPFVDCGVWAHADGTALRTAAIVIDVAHRLAMQSLTIGDVERAAWAVDRGLLAAPTNELLHRDRMRIADMAGDASAVDACMRRLRLRVEADGGWLTPETEALYRELRGSGPPGVEDAS